MSSQLSGKTALITGGTSGIGLATARLFAENGAQVAIVARKNAGAVAAELGKNALGIDCDVSNRRQVFSMVAQVAKAFGKIDIVFANAGIAIYRELEEWTEDEVDLLFAVNAKGQFYTAQAAAPHMPQGGTILLTGSVATHMGQPAMAVYAASKASARSLAETLSADLLHAGVRVLCLTPGPVDTPIFEKGGLDSEAAAAKLQQVAKSVPLGRPGSTEELANAALFLASEGSSFMLGTEIIVDGGKTSVRS